MIDSTIYPCLGALVGDTVGSVYEFDNIKTPDFQPLFDEQACYTDDSIMTIAVADWIASTDRSQNSLENKLVEWGNKYPDPPGSYGSTFSRWLFHPDWLCNLQTGEWGKRMPYNTWGNGSAMRASACGWAAYSFRDTMDLGKRSAEITHNHPEGIKGAQAVAVAIHLALKGESKETIRECLEHEFDYDLQHTCDEIRPTYGWEASCQGTVPLALIAFFESHDFESAIRLAVSLGGDSDTLACITGSIAQAYYKEMPEEIVSEMQTRLPAEFWDIMKQLQTKIA